MNIKNLLFGLLGLLLISLSASAQIQAGKSINITISGVPDSDRSMINSIYPVSDGGMINMPFLGQVHAGGMRTEELAASLQSRYKSAGIYTNPTIQVINTTVGGSASQETVTVGGYVGHPGPIPFTQELTLWGAVQAAGGATEFGSMHRVKIIRDGNQKTYDLTKTQFKGIPLQRNDAIDVPQKTVWGN